MNNEEMSKMNINWYPGHMAKTRRQIEEDLKLIDVVIELLDARIPISSRNPDIKKLTKNKKRIILLNKCDLSDEKINKKWVDALSKEAPVILTDSNSGKGIEKVTKKIEELMKEEVERQIARGRINKTIRVMILGIPNVGKSSFINRISKKTSMEVGNRPGVTKSKQWIRIGKNQELLDTPGVLWPKFESNEIALNLAFTGTIKDDILERTEIAYELLKVLYSKYKSNIQERYKITEEEIKQIENESNSIYELMQLIGRKRGALVAGGNTDDEKIARIILDDFRNCKLGKISLEEP
jgi:ribosome biogenesis GTPase A